MAPQHGSVMLRYALTNALVMSDKFLQGGARLRTSGVGARQLPVGGGAGRPCSENKNEARSIELSHRVAFTVTQSQLPFSLVAAFDASEPKIEAGLDWKCTNAWPFHAT
jgi:hypothetical protein